VNSLQTALEVFGLLLNIVLVVLLFRGFLPKYSALFAYNFAAFLITIIEHVLFQGANRGSSLYRQVYWTSEIVWDFLLFVLLAVLIHQALAGRPERQLARKVLLIVLVAAVVLPFILFHDGLFNNRWFRGASQVWNFGGAILTLVLWGAVIASRDRDSQLMMVCAGHGIALTGSAVAWGIRQLAAGSGIAEDIHNIADLFAALTYVSGLGLWCWAFRYARQQSPPQTAQVT
jgi:hypothetical protein